MKDVRFSHNTVVLPLTNQYAVSLCMLLLHIKKLLVKILNCLKDNVMDNQRIFELPSHALYFFFQPQKNVQNPQEAELS